MKQSFQFKQWTVEIDLKEESYRIHNNGGDFYQAEMGAYGQPLIFADPKRAFDAPDSLSYVDASGNQAEPKEKIAGIVCKDGPRFSLTSAENKGIVIEHNDDGSISIDGEQWFLETLFRKDANRIIGYDGYYSKEQSQAVKIIELGDLDLF